MKIKQLLSIIIVIVTFATITGCSQKKGVNILEQDETFVGEFYAPSSKKVEDNSALGIIAAINERGYKIDTAYKTRSDDRSIIESYKLNCYGLNFEIFHYEVTSEKFKEISQTGKYSIKDSSGAVLAEFDAKVNGHYVLFFSSNVDYEGKDRTEENNKIAKIFMDMKLD